MRQVPLTQGFIALVDDADFERVNRFNWWASQHGKRVYAVRHVWVRKGVYRKELLHRFILQPNPKVQVDHKDGNGLNCQQYNLRMATNTQNSQNKRKTSRNTSGYKGVSRFRGRWRAKICVNYLDIHLGVWDTALAAAQAYDRASRIYHGQFGQLNFPTPAPLPPAADSEPASRPIPVRAESQTDYPSRMSKSGTARR